MSESYSLITGASSGIGKATAKKLAGKGRNLILLARRKKLLEELRNEILTEHKIDVLIYQIDVRNLDNLNSFFSEIQDFNIDILVNNAGLALGKSSIEEYDWQDFETMIDTNVKAFTRIAQLAIPFIKKTQGHIVNISSISGIEAYEGGSVYCATKAYVKMLSKSMRLDLAGTGVRVTDIAPGAVDTEFSLVRFKGSIEASQSVYKGFVPLYAEDIADAIIFALDRPSSVNIEYMLIMPTSQASATRIYRN